MNSGIQMTLKPNKENILKWAPKATENVKEVDK